MLTRDDKIKAFTNENGDLELTEIIYKSGDGNIGPVAIVTHGASQRTWHSQKGDSETDDTWLTSDRLFCVKVAQAIGTHCCGPAAEGAQEALEAELSDIGQEMREKGQFDADRVESMFLELFGIESAEELPETTEKQEEVNKSGLWRRLFRRDKESTPSCQQTLKTHEVEMDEGKIRELVVEEVAKGFAALKADLAPANVAEKRNGMPDNQFEAEGHKPGTTIDFQQLFMSMMSKVNELSEKQAVSVEKQTTAFSDLVVKMDGAISEIGKISGTVRGSNQKDVPAIDAWLGGGKI